MRQWRSAGPALEEQRARELRALTDEQAIAAADALLEIGAALPLPESRRAWSGLVEMQRLFQRLPRST
jgi:hypothetical protein